MPNAAAPNVASRRSTTIVAALCLWLAAVVPYAGTLANGFIEFDDNGYVFRNTFVAAGLTPASLAYAWTTFDVGNWIPVTWMSYLVDASIYGIEPRGFHATNVLLHGVNVLLLWCWLWRLTAGKWSSWAIAGLFATHPLHVESVAWVAERKDLLSMLFLLLLLMAYEAYSKRPSVLRYAVVTLFYALGLLSKSMLVTVPLLLLLVDLWREAASTLPDGGGISPCPARDRRLVVLEKLPWLLMAAAIAVVTIRAQGSGPVSAFTPFSRLPLLYRVANAICGYGWYAWKTVVPTGLCAMYAHPLLGISWIQVALSAGGLAVVSGAFFVAGRHRPGIAWGWSWFVVALVPVIGLLQVGTQAYADRYSYIPQVGLLAAIIWSAQGLLRAVPSRHRRELAAAVIMSVMVGNAVLTARQVRFWRDTDAVWQRVLDIDPSNWAAHQMLGRYAFADGRWREASGHFERACAGNPRLPEEFASLGEAHVRLGESDAAIESYLRALEVTAGHTRAMHGLLDVLRKEKRLNEAYAALQRYLARRPDDPVALVEAGLIHARAGRLEEAVALFARAVAVEPDRFAARMNLGLALVNVGKSRDAVQHLRRAVELRPDSADAHVTLGMALQETGLLDEATDHFVTAVRLNPSDTDAQRRLEAMRSSAADSDGDGGGSR